MKKQSLLGVGGLKIEKGSRSEVTDYPRLREVRDFGERV